MRSLYHKRLDFGYIRLFRLQSWYNDRMKRKAKRRPVGYRVDVKSSATGCYVAYTSLRATLSLDTAMSLARHLKRSKAAGRVVRMPGNRVLLRAKKGNPNVVRDRVQALREKFGFGG
jgi:hypothetical protein